MIIANSGRRQTASQSEDNQFVKKGVPDQIGTPLHPSLHPPRVSTKSREARIIVIIPTWLLARASHAKQID
jgi:hypothetical protein